jgi:hypothetical protein
LGFERRNGGLTGEENTFNVDVEGQVPGVFVHAFDRGDTDHSSVTHKDMQCAQATHRLLHHASDLGLLADIGLNRH